MGPGVVCRRGPLKFGIWITSRSPGGKCALWFLLVWLARPISPTANAACANLCVVFGERRPSRRSSRSCSSDVHIFAGTIDRLVPPSPGGRSLRLSVSVLAFLFHKSAFNKLRQDVEGLLGVRTGRFDH